MSTYNRLFSQDAYTFSDTGGYRQQNDLYECIEHGKLDDIDQVLDPYLVHLYALIKNDKVFAVEIMHYIWAQLNLIAIRAGIPNDYVCAIQKQYYYQLEQADTVYEMIEICRRQVIEFTEIINSSRDEVKYSLLVENCCKFIRRNIYQNITPSLVAESMHFSRSYVSHKFKAETGMTLNQFIKNEKVTEAKKLIHANVPFSYITEKLGFASQSHFTEIFKERTGLTPNQYRKAK